MAFRLRPRIKPILCSLQGRLRGGADTPVVHLTCLLTEMVPGRLATGNEGVPAMRDRAVWIPALSILSIPFLVAMADWCATALGMFRSLVDLLV